MPFPGSLAGSFASPSRQTALGGAALTTPQPTFSNTVWLFGFEGTSGAAPTDESSRTATMGRTTGTQSAAQSKFGSQSALFSGSAAAYWENDNAALEIGASDFSIECFVRFNAVSADHTFACCWNATTTRTFLFYWNQGAGELQFPYSTSGGAVAATPAAAWSPSADTWYHIAVCRSSGVLRFFVDGIQIGSDVAMSATLYNSTRQKHVGYSNDGTIPNLNGYMDEFRWVIGEGIYTTNFAVPTAAHPRS
jgi:hypothetical protein